MRLLGETGATWVYFCPFKHLLVSWWLFFWEIKRAGVERLFSWLCNAQKSFKCPHPKPMGNQTAIRVGTMPTWLALLHYYGNNQQNIQIARKDVGCIAAWRHSVCNIFEFPILSWENKSIWGQLYNLHGCRWFVKKLLFYLYGDRAWWPHETLALRLILIWKAEVGKISSVHDWAGWMPEVK